MSLRKEILEVSRSMLIEKGFGKMSMRKIAAAANVSATSIYLHFKNKDELLLALMEDSIAQLAEALSNSINGNGDALYKLETLADTFLRFALERPQEYEIIYMVRPEEMPKFPKDKFQHIRKVYEMLADIIEEGRQQGQLDVDDPLVSAYTLWAQLHGIVSVILSRRLDTRIARDKFIEQAKDQIIQGFITQKTPV